MNAKTAGWGRQGRYGLDWRLLFLVDLVWFGLVFLICWLVGMPGERRGEGQGACWLGLEVGFADGPRSATRLPATLVMERQS